METTFKIALIIPVRLTASTYEGEARLARICDAVPRDLFDILISDYGTLPRHRGPIDRLEQAGIRVARHPSPHPLFSIGQARDFGVQMAQAPVIVFNDVDFLGTPAMYRAIHAEAVSRALDRNLFDFFCVPVLFLTEGGTKAWLAADDAAKPFSGPLTVDALEAATDDIQSVAYGSSAMVVNRHHYLTVGGHDPRFAGHGAEDYDLLHRLAAIAPKGPRPHDYFTDYKDNNVRHYWGFRPFFALHGLDLLPFGTHLVHLWHPRRKEKGYFRPARNFRLLKRVMKRFDRTGSQPRPLAHLAGNGGLWTILYRTPGDLDLIRQLLPLSSGYVVVNQKYLRHAPAISGGMLASGSRLLIATPGLEGDPHVFAGNLLPGIGLLHIAADKASGSYTFAFAPTPANTVTLRPSFLRAPSGKRILTFWPQFDVDGLPRLSTGTIAPPQPTDSPLFASFGEKQIKDGRRRNRPRRKKKSPLLVRIRRWFTGY